MPYITHGSLRKIQFQLWQSIYCSKCLWQLQVVFPSFAKMDALALSWAAHHMPRASWNYSLGAGTRHAVGLRRTQ